MLLMIIGTSILFGYMMSSLQVTQSVAESIAALQVNKWVVLAAINALLLGAGMFLPPAAIILMTTPILMPVILAAGFDPIWFGVVLTINMELGLITPPVGLNLFVINGITPDIKLQTILRGALPFMGCMVVAILLLCVFPGLATWLPQSAARPMCTTWPCKSLKATGRWHPRGARRFSRRWPPALHPPQMPCSARPRSMRRRRQPNIWPR
jgi:C4-dicarboxylate transporter DctM subunit